LHREYGKLRGKVFASAFWADRFLFSHQQGFEGMIAVFASVFKYGH
jgi:hypothetical protein